MITIYYITPKGKSKLRALHSISLTIPVWGLTPSLGDSTTREEGLLEILSDQGPSSYLELEEDSPINGDLKIILDSLCSEGLVDTITR